jgi:hypothetical protein
LQNCFKLSASLLLHILFLIGNLDYIAFDSTYKMLSYNDFMRGLHTHFGIFFRTLVYLPFCICLCSAPTSFESQFKQSFPLLYNYFQEAPSNTVQIRSCSYDAILACYSSLIIISLAWIWSASRFTNNFNFVSPFGWCSGCPAWPGASLEFNL